MHITVLKSKIAYGTITQKELFYVGSITIDEAIMQQANIRENEKVQVVNLNNGERLETYAIKGKAGSKVFCLNGAAARKAEIGDKIFIISYAMIDAKETLTPIIVDLEHVNSVAGHNNELGDSQGRERRSPLIADQDPFLVRSL